MNVDENINLIVKRSDNMKKLIRKLLGPLAILSLAVGVRLSVLKMTNAIGTKALPETALIKKATNVSSGTGVVFENGQTINVGTGNADISVTTESTVPIVTKYYRNSASTHTIMNNSNGEIRLYAGAGNGGEIQVSIPDTHKFTNVAITTDTNTGLSINGAASTTSTNINQALDNESNILSLKDVGSGQVRLKTIEVTFETYTPKNLVNLTVAGTLTKTNYYDGESFNPGGLTFTAHYDNSTSAPVTDLSYNPDPLVTDTTSVTVSHTYRGVTKSVSVSGLTVIADPVSSIAIKTMPNKTTFALGEVFKADGLVITVTKGSGNIFDITTGFTLSAPNMKQLGSQVVTISYETKEATYNVKLTNVGARAKGTATATDLFFAEYAECSVGNNKYLEIYNGTGLTLNLSGYSIKLYSNGATTPGQTHNLTGSLDDGEVYVIANAGANADILAKANVTHEVTYFNGNDALGLYKNDVLIDLIGEIGVDPGTTTGWTGAAANGTGSTVDTTLIRTSTTISPNSIFTWAEWNTLGKDVFTNIGIHESIAFSGGVTALEQATAFRDFVLNGPAASAHGTCEAVLAELEVEYAAMKQAAKDLFDTTAGAEWDNARTRLNYLRAWKIATTPSPLRYTASDVFTISSALIIGVIGLSALLGFYFLSKKKKLA